MQQTTIIGIDCATIDSKVALSVGVVESDRCVIRFAGACPSERRLAEEVSACLIESTRVLVAFDAPLGWPQPMGDVLGVHRAGQSLEIGAHELFRRETDRFVRVKLGKQRCSHDASPFRVGLGCAGCGLHPALPASAAQFRTALAWRDVVDGERGRQQPGAAHEARTFHAPCLAQHPQSLSAHSDAVCGLSQGYRRLSSGWRK